MDILKNLNLALAFFVELGMLASFIWAGVSFNAITIVKVLIAVVVPLIIVILWGAFFAPSSDNRLRQPWLEIGELVLFSAAAFTLYESGHKSVAIAFIVTAIVNMLLAVLWHQH